MRAGVSFKHPGCRHDTTATNPIPRHRAGSASLAASIAFILTHDGGTGAEPAKINSVISEQVKTEESARSSQKRVEQLDDESTKMLADYRQMTAEAKSLASYNTQLATQVTSQQQQIDEMTRQLGEIETTAREVLPMMDKMLATLDQFVQLDVPFLGEERTQSGCATEGSDDARRCVDLGEVSPHRRGLSDRDGIRPHHRVVSRAGRREDRRLPACWPHCPDVSDARRQGNRLLGRRAHGNGRSMTTTPMPSVPASRSPRNKPPPISFLLRFPLPRRLADDAVQTSAGTRGWHWRSVRFSRWVGSLTRRVAAQSEGLAANLDELLEQTRQARQREAKANEEA